METTSTTLLDDYLTTDEAAKELDVHWRTILRWKAYGYGPPQTRIGRRVYYHRDALAAWIKEQRDAPQGKAQ